MTTPTESSQVNSRDHFRTFEYPAPESNTASAMTTPTQQPGPDATRAALVVTVLGTPGPQGSKRNIGKGVMIESSKKVKPWRARVEAAATLAAAGQADGPAWTILDGPLIAEFVFSLVRGKTVKRTHHTTYPDLSKLIRSTEDALTGAGIWADDARVVAYHRPRKVYAGDADPDALPEPGAVIRIWAVRP